MIKENKMPTKKTTKKVVKKSRINPPLVKLSETSFEDLGEGCCFIDNSNVLLIKLSEAGEQSAVSLADGQYYSDLCGSQVIPVDITINWKRRK